MTPAQMLSVWETGSELSPLDRGLLAVQTAGVTWSEAADLSLGERNRALAQFYREHFGSTLNGLTECVQCGEKLEFDFDLRQVTDAPSLEAQDVVAVGAWRFRLPTSRAVAAALNGGDLATAHDRLLEHCLVTSGESAPTWSDGEIAIIEEALSNADSLAEILIKFKCPECGAIFEDALDLGTFLWCEIEDSAGQLFDEIHVLASSYGWTEEKVLGLSSRRREAYVRRVLG
jgi:hypothetical protein